MKVVHVQKVKAFAGSEKYFLSLIPEQIEQGWDAHLVLVINESDVENCEEYLRMLEDEAIPFSVIHAKNDNAIFNTLKKLKQELIRLEPDIVHSHLVHADLWCAVLKRRKKINFPLVSTKHGYEEIYLAKHGFDGTKVPKNRYYRLCKFSEKYIDRSFAVSKGLRGLFIEAGISEPTGIETIHHGFDMPKIISKKEDCRYSDKQILILGRVIPFKGHNLGLEAFAEVVKEIGDAKCVIVGNWEDEFKAQLDAIVKDKGLEDHVVFEGFKSNVYDYLLSSDILLVPSISEGFGLVFLEGINAEIPIVGFDVAATNEIVENGISGALIPAYDASKMGKELVNLLNNESARKAQAARAKERLESYFTLKRMTDETIKFYEDVLNS